MEGNRIRAFEIWKQKQGIIIKGNERTTTRMALDMAMTANINEEAGASSATSTREEEDAEPHQAAAAVSSTLEDLLGMLARSHCRR